MKCRPMGVWALVWGGTWWLASAVLAQPSSAQPSKETPNASPAPVPASGGNAQTLPPVTPPEQSPQALPPVTPPEQGPQPGPTFEEGGEPQRPASGGSSDHNALISVGFSGVMVARKGQPDGRDRYRFRAIVLTLGYRYQIARKIALQIAAHGGIGGATIAAVEPDNLRFHRDRERIGRGYSAGMDLGPLFGEGLFYFAPTFSARALMRKATTVDLVLRKPDRSGAIERSVAFDPPIVLLGGRVQFGFRLFGGKGDLAFGLDAGRARRDGTRYMGLFLRLGLLLPEIARGG